GTGGSGPGWGIGQTRRPASPPSTWCPRCSFPACSYSGPTKPGIPAASRPSSPTFTRSMSACSSTRRQALTARAALVWSRSSQTVAPNNCNCSSCPAPTGSPLPRRDYAEGALPYSNSPLAHESPASGWVAPVGLVVAPTILALLARPSLSPSREHTAQVPLPPVRTALPSSIAITPSATPLPTSTPATFPVAAPRTTPRPASPG